MFTTTPKQFAFSWYAPKIAIFLILLTSLSLLGQEPYHVELTRQKIHTSDSRPLHAFIGGLEIQPLSSGAFAIVVIDGANRSLLQYHALSPESYSVPIQLPKEVGIYQVGLFNMDKVNAENYQFSIDESVASTEFEIASNPVIELSANILHFEDHLGLSALFYGLDLDQDWDIQVLHLEGGDEIPIPFSWIEGPGDVDIKEMSIPTPILAGDYLIRFTALNRRSLAEVIVEQGFVVTHAPVVKGLPTLIFADDGPTLIASCFGIDQTQNDRMTLAAYGSPHSQFLEASWVDLDFDFTAFQAPSMSGLYELRLFEDWSESGPGPQVANRIIKVLGPPSAPTNLRLVSHSASSVKIAWDHPDTCCVTRIEVERRDLDTPGSTWQYIGLGLSNKTYQDFNLQSQTRYRYRVRACSQGMCSGYSNQITVTTTEWPPSRPSLDGHAPNWQEIHLTITPGPVDDTHDPVDYFEIHRHQGGASAVIGTTSGTTFVDTGLEEATYYGYHIYAYNTGGSSFFLYAFSTITPAAPAPSIPENLTAVPVSATQVQLDWDPGPVDDDHAPAESFRIQRAVGTGSFSTVATIPASQTDLLVFSLQPLTEYRFRVNARRNIGSGSGYTPPVSATTLPPLPPPRPVGLNITDVGMESIHLAWDAGTPAGNNDPAESFLLQRALMPGAFSDHATLPATSPTVFEDTNLEPDTDYYYRLAAINGGGQSAFTNVVMATTDPPPPEPDLTCDNPSFWYNGLPQNPRNYCFQVQAINVGTGTFPDNTVHYYLSDDNILDTGDLLLGTSEIVIPPGWTGTTWNVQLCTTFPTDVSGPKYILFQADGGEDVDETNENNNLCVMPFTVPDTTGPDLWIRPGTYYEGDLVSGESFSVTNLGVQNQGTTSTSGTSTIAIGFSSPFSNPPLQFIALNTFSVPTLAAGEIYDLGTVSVTIPAAFPQGGFQLVIWADFMTGTMNGAIAESDELNNWARFFVQIQ